MRAASTWNGVCERAYVSRASLDIDLSVSLFVNICSSVSLLLFVSSSLTLSLSLFLPPFPVLLLVPLSSSRLPLSPPLLMPVPLT